MVTLAEKCLVARKANKMSQKKFAELIGTNQTEISFIERGFLPQSPKKVNAINRYYQECMGGTHNGN